jgi:hypothetical protein
MLKNIYFLNDPRPPGKTGVEFVLPTFGVLLSQNSGVVDDDVDAPELLLRCRERVPEGVASIHLPTFRRYASLSKSNVAKIKKWEKFNIKCQIKPS